MLVTAESCTGGWVAQVVTSVAGSSDWFERGFVTYSNAAKQELLGVHGEHAASSTARSARKPRARWRAGALARSKGTVALADDRRRRPGRRHAGEAGRHGVLRLGERARGDAQRDAPLPRRPRSVRRQSVIHALEGVLKLLDESA